MRDWSAPSLPPRWARPGQPPFIARGDEVAELRAAWSDAVGGAGRAVFIGGTPGIGKSRLISTVCAELHAAGAVVLVGTCVQEFGAPFEPFDQALRQLLPIVRDGADADLTDSLNLLEATFSRSPRPAEAEVGQGRLYEAVIDILRAATNAKPVVLVVEDLHWADVTAIRLLTQVVVNMVDSRLLVLGTMRSTAPDRSEPLADAIAQLRRLDGVRQFELSPFTPDEITEYVRRSARISADAARASTGALSELTGGNPFLLRETWRQVLDAGSHHGHEERLVELPDTVADILRSRIATLDTPELAVVELAALLGQDVDLGELLAISDEPAAVTLAAIDTAVRAGLLEPPRTADDSYHFPHAIARQSLLDQISGTAVIHLHARIAQTLESSFPAAPRLVQRLAHHYSAARALGFGERAVTYLTRSAELAHARLAHEDAARLFERAAEIAQDAAERDALRLRAARNWIFTSDFARARALDELVFELGNPRNRVFAAIGFEEATRRPGLPGQRAVELLSGALSGIPEDATDPLYVEGLGALSRAIAFTGAFDEAQRLAARAVALARDLGNKRVLAAVLRTSISQTLRPQQLADSLARTAELANLSEGSRNEALGAGANLRCAACYLVGDRAGFDQAELGMVETVHQWGSYWNYWLECERFGRIFIEGRLSEAALASDRVLKAESRFRSDVTSGANAVQSYMVRRESGAVEAIRPLITGDESPTSRWAPGLLAIYTELELAAPAHRLLTWMLDHDDPASRESAEWPARLAFLTEAALWLRDDNAAARIRPWMAEYSGLNLMSGYFVGMFGSADRYLGEIDSLCGTGSPMDSLDAALELDQRFDAGLHIAQTLATTAAHLRSRDPQSTRAAELTDRALLIARPAGMIRVLRRLGFAEATSGQTQTDGLTAREVDVIRLIAEGLSNRGIADRLVISEHTAANHIRSILTKTGAANRTQAAMYARAEGLL